ncbi:MAG: hypothetical protein QOC61_1952 [Acidobacteriota bacterium]|jgi:hypothetical protein|nr:hypothetical protein [Acidobacteriota bacterium]
MKVRSKGVPVTHARIETLCLRVPAGDARSAKALASAVASRLALRAGDLKGVAGQGTVSVRVRVPASVSRERLAETIAGKIATHAETEKRGPATATERRGKR